MERFEPIAESIVLTTTFERAHDGSYPDGFEYSRDDNPNRRNLERSLAALEGGFDAAAFASGSAASMTLFQALTPGDRVVVSDDCYVGVRHMLDKIFVRWGLLVEYVDSADPSALRNALREPTAVLFIETPGNPRISITDLKIAVEYAKDVGALVACDNTVATPCLQRPLALGCDFVIHSTTKYLSGGDDAMGGAIVAAESSDLWKRIRFAQIECGCIPSPFASWLTSRSLPTLDLRVTRQSETALSLARALQSDPRIDSVLYPFIESHAGYDVARAQMRAGGALMSILVKGSAADAMAVSNRLKVFKRATSFGGPTSLVEHRKSVEGPTSKTPDNLLRVYVGLESIEELVNDFDQALTAART